MARHRQGRLPEIQRVFNSHCHEDHIVGNHLFPDIPWHVHRHDAIGFRSIDDFMGIYGFPEPIRSSWKQRCLESFHYTPRPDVSPYEHGDLFDLGGVTLRIVHTPGHTRGHCLLIIEWGSRGRAERLAYLGDIELTGFGPYYGDAWSNLEDFEQSLVTARGIEASWYATFHHIGVLDPESFQERLGRFAQRIVERETALLEYLETPRSMQEIVSHRFIYRPGPAAEFVDSVERRSMAMHLERLLAGEQIKEVEPGRYLACGA